MGRPRVSPRVHQRGANRHRHHLGGAAQGRSAPEVATRPSRSERGGAASECLAAWSAPDLAASPLNAQPGRQHLDRRGFAV